MVVSGVEASMSYKITNLGAVTVSPQKMGTKLVEFINTGNTQMKTALKPIGVAILGTGGLCCSTNVDLKTVVDKNPTTTTRTTTPKTTTTVVATGTTIAMAKVDGSLTLVATGLNKTTVEAVAKKSIATHFGVNESGVTLSAVESRRLAEDGNVRRLKGNWAITYSFMVAPAKVTAVQAKVDSAKTSPAAFKSAMATLLVTNLKAAGVPASVADGISVSSASAGIVLGTSPTQPPVPPGTSSAFRKTVTALAAIALIQTLLFNM